MSWFRVKALAYLKGRINLWSSKKLLEGPCQMIDIHSGPPPAIPLPDEGIDWTLTIEEKVAILAALHDLACHGVEKIDPAPLPAEVRVAKERLKGKFKSVK